MLIPQTTRELLEKAAKLTIGTSIENLYQLSQEMMTNGTSTVAYEVPGKGQIEEVTVSQVRNGISVNYLDPYMRRRDADSMLIGDSLPTEKPRFQDALGKPFDSLKKETFEWLASQELAVFFFRAGQNDIGIYGMAIAPANAGFFCYALGLLQGVAAPDSIPLNTPIRTIIYVAPPFRHTHFEGKQRVVHFRTGMTHEIFSYNLYPGPSAKKGVYSSLIDFGEQEGWITAHASVVQVVTPYGNRVSIMHEGASGGGKSEMHEHIHREQDGRIAFARNPQSGEKHYLSLPRGCDLRPIADDMAICHPSFQKGDGYLTASDAEAGWFVRVDHIRNYGTDPDIESLSIHPQTPLLFLNIDAPAHGTALLWEHIQDAPGKPCPNPRVIFPRTAIPHTIDKPARIQIRSFGVRTPPCTREQPTYGILGMLHVLPPSLAWLWRLVSLRGHANPSIIGEEGISSEGVGSYWPFATGRRITQANILLQQIIDTPQVRYILCPNQYIGAWKVSFNPQWLTREFLARRGGAVFNEEEIGPARCSLLGYSLRKFEIEGQELEKGFLQVDKQNEVGTEAYDQGARLLHDFFKQELAQYHKHPELHKMGNKIIDICLNDGSLDDYLAALPSQNLILQD